MNDPQNQGHKQGHQSEERESIATDVLIVGAGPAGLSAAIRIKQLAAERQRDIGVTIVEKAAEVGGHIISGAIIDPVGLDELIPDWRNKGAPTGVEVSSDHLHYLTERGGFSFPGILLPAQMKTKGGRIISLGELCKWLASEAEALGVEIYPATAAVDFTSDKDGAITGIITGDLGVDKDGKPTEGYAEGIALNAKYTLLGEGARGSLSKKLIERFDLAADASPQSYSLGIKEIWQVPESQHQQGRVDHFMGWPLDDATNGGGFLYHAADHKVFVGQVTYLSYANPTLSPFGEFQRLKSHPKLRDVLNGGTRIAYGARVLSSGGWQAIPKLAFPGGALIGCAAGFMNVPRLKGIHSAMRSGRATGETVAEAIIAGRANDLLERLQANVMATGIEAELKPVRNVKPLWSRYGTRIGAFLAGIELWLGSLFKISLFGTLRGKRNDAEATKSKSMQPEISYPRPDNSLSFDRASSIYLANIAHSEDQPVHLKLADADVPLRDNLPVFGEPATLYCPAGVYEIVEQDGQPTFRINAANCVHCKTCDIKDPAQNITWVPPEGGSGPNYSGM